MDVGVGVFVQQGDVRREWINQIYLDAGRTVEGLVLSGTIAQRHVEIVDADEGCLWRTCPMAA